MRRLARIILLVLAVVLLVLSGREWRMPQLGTPSAPASQTSPNALAPISGPIERILVEKAARRITLYQGDDPVRVWPIALGFAPIGDKIREGDGKTPEGVFRIDRKNAQSAFHLSLGLDYPQAEDRARARAGGYSPGGDIMIHGQPNALPDATHLPGDWTAGCIAISNAQMREIWPHIKIGTLVEVRP